jgi:hypothetical protein
VRRKPLIWLAATGAVVLAALLLFRSWITRDTTAPVSVAKVVKQYKGERTATTVLPEGAKIPQAGVYTYTTDGFEKTDLLGGSRHDYPAQTTITVKPTDCGYVQTWTALDKRSEAWTYCALDGAIRPTDFQDVHNFYAHNDDRTYTCSGGALSLKPGADPVTITCVKKGTTRVDHVKTIGAESVDVGGTAVDTVHLRTQTRMSGSTVGTATFDDWLDRATGLPVRITADVDNKSDTPIGAKVHYLEQYELKLTSADPAG